MKLNRFLARQVRGFRQFSVPGAVAGRQTLLSHFGNFGLRSYKGCRTRDRLVLMRIGAVAMQQAGRTYLAEAGDALLIPAGHGEVSFLRCSKERGIQAEILEFDHRTLAPWLRNSATWESLAARIDDAPQGAVPLAGFVANIPHGASPGGRDQFHLIMAKVFGQFWRGVPQFLKSNFYLRRWNLFVLLEQCVLRPDGVEEAAARYPGGPRQFRKDCLVFCGDKPAAIMSRRRCDLATAWLRCGHSIEAVGKALGFSSEWEFQSVYAGKMRVRCADVQSMPRLDTAEPEELAAAMLPFWWSHHSVVAKIPKAKRSPYLSEQYPCEVATDPTDAPLGARELEEEIAQRKRFTEELRNNAKDFVAMKATGADVIVPIFGDRQVLEALAA